MLKGALANDHRSILDPCTSLSSTTPLLRFNMDDQSIFGMWKGLSAAAALLVIFAWSVTKRLASRLPFPPGPRPLPFLGNILDIPREKEALVYNQMAQKYGV